MEYQIEHIWLWCFFFGRIKDVYFWKWKCLFFIYNVNFFCEGFLLRGIFFRRDYLWEGFLSREISFEKISFEKISPLPEDLFREDHNRGQTNSKWFSSRRFFPKTNEPTISALPLCMKPQVDLFLFVFWKKLKTPKIHFEINWPLEYLCFCKWNI